MNSIKNVIFLKKDIPDRIKKEVRYWNLYAKVSPFVFLTLALILHQSDAVPLDMIVYAGGMIFAITAVVWWFWTVSTIGHISQRVHKAESGVQDILTDLRIIKELVRELKNK